MLSLDKSHTTLLDLDKSRHFNWHITEDMKNKKSMVSLYEYKRLIIHMADRGNVFILLAFHSFMEAFSILQLLASSNFEK